MTPIEIRASCTRTLVHHGPSPLAERLQGLIDELGEHDASDLYGSGALIEEFEAEIAEILGKPAAVFMPSGTMAQQIALRIWCDEAGIGKVGYHPSSHLHLHEHQALEELHRLEVTLLGDPERPLDASDLDGVGELGAVLIELPQRELGGVLPTWDALQALISASRSRASAVHLDGARLWEAVPFYDRPVAHIAALFDSVYVSFYKGLGGIAGAVLAGPADHIDQAKIWQRRHGGNLVALWPYVLSARRSLAERRGKMPAYVAHMQAFSAAVSGIEGIRVVPDPPHTNMAHIQLAGETEALHQAALEVSSETGVWVGQRFREGGWFELPVGDASLEIQPEEFADLMRMILARAADLVEQDIRATSDGE